MTPLISIVFANFLISAISLIGALVLTNNFLKNKNVASLMVSFAAGVLIATAFLDILPEAFQSLATEQGFFWAMIGMIFAFLMERLLLWHHHHHETHDIHPTAVLVLFGDSIHNFIDGLAIAATFLVNPALGMATTFAIAMHEIPQELADFSVLIHSGMSRQKAILFNFLSALTAIAGGVVGFYFFTTSTHVIGATLAFTGGLFIYIASADLIPELHTPESHKGWMSQTLLFLFGVLFIYITVSLVH